MTYFKKIIGEKCYLSPMSLDDAEKFTSWLNDLEISKGMIFSSQIISVEAERQIIKSFSESKDYVLAIVDKNNNTLLGCCGLHSINHLVQSAKLSIFIGEISNHGKGIGTEATRLLCDFGFNILNLHNIILSVYEYNQNAVRCYEKAGFKVIGRRREAQPIAGKRYDVVLMDILASEFESPFVKKFFD